MTDLPDPDGEGGNARGLPVIRLRPKANARAIRHGFPWVFADELVADRRTRAIAPGSMALLESLGLPGLLHVPMKIVVDVVLYLLSYRVQNKWVFREEEKQ